MRGGNIPPLPFIAVILIAAACHEGPKAETGGPDTHDPQVPAGAIAPDDIVYLGAFTLPVGSERPETFAYGGNAMAFRADGDPQGAADGYEGSLLVMGHDRIAWELPGGGLVAEVTIPAPVDSGEVSDLNRAEFVHGFADVTDGVFEGKDEVPHIGMVWIDAPETGPLVHLGWGVHFEDGSLPTHAAFSPDLDAPATRGPYFLGTSTPFTTGYMLALPDGWAATHAEGRVVGTGQFRDGGWSGKGPSVFAYEPWTDAAGTMAEAGSTLPVTELLHYESTETNEDITSRSMEGFQDPDQWEGAAWVEVGDRAALIFAGTKATGARNWYGYLDASDPGSPCVDVKFVGQFTTCWTDQGQPCPADELGGCEDPSSYRGWWSSSFDAWFLLYDPADLAAVASGDLEPWSPQPYASLDLDDHLILQSGVEAVAIGSGAQRAYRIGAMALDAEHRRLYVLELFAEDVAPVIHVFEVR